MSGWGNMPWGNMSGSPMQQPPRVLRRPLQQPNLTSNEIVTGRSILDSVRTNLPRTITPEAEIPPGKVIVC